MKPLRRAPVQGTVFALALIAAALAISLLIRPYLEPDTFLLFLLAVWLSAWYYGRIIGFVAVAVSAVTLAYFFLSGFTPLWAVPARLCFFGGLASLIVLVTAGCREARRLLASTLASIPEAILVTGRSGRVTLLNPIAETLTGWTAEAAHGKPAEDVLRLIDASTRQTIDSPLSRALVDRTAVTAAHHTLLIPRTGAEVPVELVAAPVRAASGRIRGAILVFRDVGKRRQLEEQAMLAEKMDAVGRLAGGLAGDFNNMLTVISGYGELLRGQIPLTNPARKYVDEIVYAGERSASLTRQLLVFSRGQKAQPRLMDLKTLLRKMEPMLHPMAGTDIEL